LTRATPHAASPATATKSSFAEPDHECCSAFRAALTPEAGEVLAGKLDLLLNVPSRHSHRIQQWHMSTLV